MERAFNQVPGVVSATVGYTGGTLPIRRTSRCHGQTGHLESVQWCTIPARFRTTA